MSIQPLYVGGRIRLVNLPIGAGSKDQAHAAEENERRIGIGKRRSYVDGKQYDEINFARLKELCPNDDGRLPEHERLHAYSTQLSDSIGFITDQLCEGFALKAEDPKVQTVIDSALVASDQLTGDGDDADTSLDDVMWDALIAGDVAVELKWDPVEETVYYEFWDGESVDMEFADRRTVTRVTREELIWVDGPDSEHQAVERVVYDLAMNPILVDEDREPILEARRQVFIDEEELPTRSEFLGVPFIPWVLLRADSRSLRGTRGESLVSTQCMEHADRYNANEQLAYIISRYNSHGNLAVIGDSAHLKLQGDERLNKDVADVLTFPGGTSLEQVTLPTDATMIEHQREVLAEAMYNTFGLTRVDPDTVSGLSGVSGYALEILNRKTEGTFRRIKRNFIRDLKGLFKRTLDMYAYRSGPTGQVQNFLLDLEEEIPDMEITTFWTVDPEEVFPNRKIRVTMGSGYIVDDVMVRDDFVASLISRDEALRKRGYPDPEIIKIEAEIEEEAPVTPEDSPFSSTKAGATVGSAQRG